MIAGTVTFVIVMFFLHPVHHKDTLPIALLWYGHTHLRTRRRAELRKLMSTPLFLQVSCLGSTARIYR
jgi:hypothetical protein